MNSGSLLQLEVCILSYPAKGSCVKSESRYKNRHTVQRKLGQTIRWVMAPLMPMVSVEVGGPFEGLWLIGEVCSICTRFQSSPRSPGGVLCVLDSRFMSGHVGQLIMRTLTISPGSPLGPGGPVMPGIPGRPWKNKKLNHFLMRKCRTPLHVHLKSLESFFPYVFFYFFIIILKNSIKS